MVTRTSMGFIHELKAVFRFTQRQRRPSYFMIEQAVICYFPSGQFSEFSFQVPPLLPEWGYEILEYNIGLTKW
jgi:hypothetical protein